MTPEGEGEMAPRITMRDLFVDDIPKRVRAVYENDAIVGSAKAWKAQMFEGDDGGWFIEIPDEVAKRIMNGELPDNTVVACGNNPDTDPGDSGVVH